MSAKDCRSALTSVQMPLDRGVTLVGEAQLAG